MKNNALGTLKYDITAGALSLVVQPIAGGSFNLPDQPTDSTGVTTGGTATFGRPIEYLIVADRLDLSQAKYEIMLATTRVAEAGGAFTYNLIASGRGAEGSTAQAWTAANTVYVFQAPTAEWLEKRTLQGILRAQSSFVHSRDALMSWDGTNFKWDYFKATGLGRGKHLSTDNNFIIAMPAAGNTAKGYGGAADTNFTASGIAIPINTGLYYEPNINGVAASGAANFRLVTWTADFVVPEHWLLIAINGSANAGDLILRVCTGATLVHYKATPAFTNAWVNFGAPYYDAQYKKGADQIVELRGAIKTGAIGSAAFTLAAGYRPANTMRFAVESNGAYGCVEITSAGVVTPQAGSNTRVNLDGIRFLAEA